MTYPPHYGQQQYPPAYPPPQPYPGQQPYGPPPQQYGGYRPPVAPFAAPARQPAYGPPAPPPPMPPKRKPNKVVYFVSLFLVLGLVGVFGVSAFSASEPNVGDCLTSMDARFFGGLEIVPCGDAKAKYEVVNKQSGRGNPSVCLDYPGGESYRNTGKRGKVYWEICAVPK